MRNEAGVTAPLRFSSPQALRVFSRGPRGFSMDPRPAQTIAARDVADRWLDLAVFDKPPLTPALSGLAVEYRILQLYSRDAGQREASLAVDVGQGTQDIGFRNDAPFLFRVRAVDAEVTLRIPDDAGADDGAPRDPGRAGPGLSLARQSGSRPTSTSSRRSIAPTATSSACAAGAYTVDVTRGPEYLTRRVTLDVGAHRHDASPRARALDRPPVARLVSPAIITSTPPAASTTSRRRRASSRAT